MKAYFIASLLFIICITTRGNGIRRLIEKDLDSRYTKFEILEVSKIKSNYYTLQVHFNLAQMLIRMSNSKITNAYSDYINRKISKLEFLNIAEPILIDVRTKLYEIHEGKPIGENDYEFCYYVKYNYSDGAHKIVKEELYFIDERNMSMERFPSKMSDFLQYIKFYDAWGKTDKWSEMIELVSLR